VPMSAPNPDRPQADPQSLSHVADSETVHHEQSSKKRPRPTGVPQLNLVSMMDVCFQLLIFFVLTASFAVGEGILAAELPTGQGPAPDPAEPPPQPITIMIRSRGGEDVAIEISGRLGAMADFQALYTQLRQLQRNDKNPNGIYMPEDPVVIQPDATVPWGAVVNAFNAAVRARFSNVNFAQPQKP
jgi:biopolymer transport protein ExbD